MSRTPPYPVAQNLPTRAAALAALCLVLLLIFPPFLFGALFGEFTVKDEKELGRKFDILVKSRMPLVEDPEIKGYVSDLVNRLVAVMPPQPFSLHSEVILHNSLNAFAVPGGSVFVHSGLILNLEHESELAGVLAHELAHVSQRHVAKRIEQMQAISVATMAGVLAGMLFGGGDAKEAVMAGSIAAGQSALLNYSREDEREADQVGMNYLVAAGFPPTGLGKGLEAIRRNRWYGGGSLPPYLSTHPASEERIGSLDARVERLSSLIRSRLEDDSRFLRARMLLRARYADPETALAHFSSGKAELSCLDKLGRAISLERLNRIPEAAEAFGQALACGGIDPLWSREAGRFYFKQGDYKQAGKYLQYAVLRQPNDLMALFFLARLLGEQGEQAQAAKYYERILLRLPEDSEVHYHLGRILGESGNYFQAHLHLAYSALYGNNKKQLVFHLDKARALASDKEQKAQLEVLEKMHGERSEFW